MYLKFLLKFLLCIDCCKSGAYTVVNHSLSLAGKKIFFLCGNKASFFLLLVMLRPMDLNSEMWLLVFNKLILSVHHIHDYAFSISLEHD